MSDLRCRCISDCGCKHIETNAERLERITETWKMTKEVENIHPTFIADMQFLFEQAERANEYRADAEHLEKAWIDKDEENKRLREALEEITSSPLGGSYTDVEEADRYQRIARQALEDSK